jgi:hypothetical protein
MAEMREAKSESSNKRGSYKKLHHIEIEPVKGENGGHIVTHHYHSDGMSYKAPETHMFGKEDGAELMDHLAKHLKVAMPEDKEENASEPATEDVNA